MRGKGGGREHCLIFVLWRYFTYRWVRGCGLGQKVLFMASWSLTFFQPGFNRTQSAWFIMACCIDWIFLHFIFLSHCCFRLSPLEIHKHLALPLSNIIFTANWQADNHFYNYIHLFLLFQVLHSNGLQKKLKMVYMVYFKWSTEKNIFSRLCKN